MYIKQYGVEGMRWGVRRDYHPQVSGWVHAARKNTKLKNNLFATQTKAENEYWQNWLSKQYPNTKLVNMSVKLKDTLIGPSEKERVDQVVKQMKNLVVKDYVQKNMQTMLLGYTPSLENSIKRELSYLATSKVNKERDKKHEKEIINMVNTNLKNLKTNPDRLTTSLATFTLFGDKYLRKQYLNSFKKKGYGFVTDDAGNWDTGHKTGYSSNVIILNKNSFDPTKTRVTVF